MARIPSRPAPKTFYRNVMAFAPRKVVGAKFTAKKPVAKGGGGKKAKGLGKGGGKGIKDWMYIGLDADISDSKGQNNAFYHNHLKNLTRDQLSRLMKKIKIIASSALSETEHEVVQQIHQLAEETIEPLLRSTIENIDELVHMIQKRLDSMEKVRLKHLERLMIEYQGEVCRPRDFAKEYFEDLADEYDIRVQLAKIIPEGKEKKGVTFVRNVLVDILTLNH